MIAQPFVAMMRDGNEYSFRPLGGTELMRLTEWLNVREGRPPTDLRSIEQVFELAMTSAHGLIKCVQLGLDAAQPGVYGENRMDEIAELVDLSAIDRVVLRLLDMPASDEGDAGNSPAAANSTSTVS